MDLRRGVEQALNVQPGEGRPLALLLLHSFFTGLAIVSFYTASSALFLHQFSVELLPFVYIGSAITSTAAGWMYGMGRRRFPGGRLLAGILLFLLLTVLAFRLALALSLSPWTTFGLLVWYTTLQALTHVEFWGLAGQLFNVRQAKRLFGLAGSGELLASFLGGLSTPLFVALAGTVNLLLVTAGALACCLVVLASILRETGGLHPESADGHQAEGAVSRLRDLVRNHYIASIFLLSLIAVTAHRLVDFAFLEQTKCQFASQDDLADFFGLFYGSYQAIAFVILTFATGRLLGRFGIKLGLRVRLEAMTLTTIGLVLVAATSASSTAALFWSALLIKMADTVFLRSLTTPAFLVLYQPLRRGQRLATQLTVESMVGPIAGGVAGALLLAMSWLGIARPLWLGLLILAVLAAWRLASKRVNHGYREALPKALRHHLLEGVSLSMDESGLREALLLRLGSDRPQEVIYALDLLTRRLGEERVPLLRPLLRHPRPEVRHHALDCVTAGHLADLTADVQELTGREEDPQVLAVAVKGLAALGESDVVDHVAAFLEWREPEVRKGAVVGLLAHGGIDGILQAGSHVIDMSASDEAEERAVAAEILGEVGQPSFYRPLLALLDLRCAEPLGALRRALEHRLAGIRRRILLLLSFTHDPGTMKRAGEQFRTGTPEQRAFALEILDTHLPRNLKTSLLPAFEDLPAAVRLRRMSGDLPQQQLGRSGRLEVLMTPGVHHLEAWIRTCAIRAAADLNEVRSAEVVEDCAASENQLVRETALWALSVLARDRYDARRHDLRTRFGSDLNRIENAVAHWQPGERPMFLTVEKVMVLKSVSIFEEVPEEMLADLAALLVEIEVPGGDPVYEKGVVGRTMYIIAAGRVRLHDGDRTFVELGPGEFFGELTTLDPEPHSASATALEDTELLGLDRDALYDLMSSHAEVLRGLIHALCQRLRAKGKRPH